MGQYRAAFLRQPRHVQNGYAFAAVGRHPDQGADGDHAGTADACNEQAIGRRQVRQRRLGQAGEIRGVRGDAFAFAQGTSFDGNDAGAESGDAGVVLVAGRLVDGALAPILGFDRHDRKAVGFCAAVAAAFARHLVDEDARCGIRIIAALAPAPLLRGAGLVVDQCRDAGRPAQFDLHGI